MSLLLCAAVIAAVGVVASVPANRALSQVDVGDTIIIGLDLRDRIDIAVLRGVLSHPSLGGPIRMLLDDPTGTSKCTEFRFRQVGAGPSGVREYLGELTLEESDHSTIDRFVVEYTYSGTGEPTTPPDLCSVGQITRPNPDPGPTSSYFASALEFSFLTFVLEAGRETLLREAGGVPITNLRTRSLAFGTFGTFCFTEVSLRNSQSFILLAPAYADGTFGALSVHRKTGRRGGP